MARQLPLHEKHVLHGAKFGMFGPWEVPLYYRNIIEEHEAVRVQAGLFDVSHMGKFRLSGSGAAYFLQYLLPRDVLAMKCGKALYMPLLNDQGGILDDLIVYRVRSEEFLLIVNAANVEKDAQWIQSRLQGDVIFKDESELWGLLALQGPKSEEILCRALGKQYGSLGYYQFQSLGNGVIARTGYTGEDGFEIMAPRASLGDLWDQLFLSAEGNLRPIGFGARDTLRLESGMLLCGHDMGEVVTPLEAGIGWAVDLKKETFLGKEALEQLQARGPAIRLVGFEMLERAIPREGYVIQKESRRLGKVTSGTFAPTLKKNIGLGYVPLEEAVLGNEFEIDVRGRGFKAKVVPLPFYRRNK